MYVWGRVIRTAIWASFHAKMGVRDASILKFRVWPTDLDFNGHVNNSQYLQLADLGRFDFLFKTGLWKKMRQHKMIPVIGGMHTRFRRSAHLFEQLTLQTQLLAIDSKWFYIGHCIWNHKKELVCFIMVRCMIKYPHQSTTTHEFIELCGINFEDVPELHDILRSWSVIDQDIHDIFVPEFKKRMSWV